MTTEIDAGTLLLVQANVAHTLKVQSRDGNTVGTVHALMIHKGTGRTTHAVLSLGGFLGMGKSFYAVPFELLIYDIAHDLYTITVDKRLLEGGPSWANNAPTFDQAYADRVAGYYGTRTEDLREG
ncbi:PRC-barrel domain-containing protein [Sphingomonas floccifaciens]|uniref:PRC-barrel domain-containing protein n=1 Tax=Sphingomonas floccifaciens TaxID=1844115 RepID=A0ABW4NDR2_9SPHN